MNISQQAGAMKNVIELSIGQRAGQRGTTSIWLHTWINEEPPWVEGTVIKCKEVLLRLEWSRVKARGTFAAAANVEFPQLAP